MLSACSINQVILMGRLTADPELRQTQTGASTCQITVAVTRAFKNQNGERQADFITVVAWNQTAEFICRYFSKGRLILVEGELRTRTYEDKRYPDVRHYVTEVNANNVSFGETASAAGVQNGGYRQSYNNNNNGGYNNGGYSSGQGGYGNSSGQGGYGNSSGQSGYGNSSGQGGYGSSSGHGGYGSSSRGGYSQSAPQQPSSVSVGDLSDFEEVISDSDLPF